MEILIASQKGCFLMVKIAQLLRIIDVAYVKLLTWREMEKIYIKITNYYVPNEENVTAGVWITFD